MSHEHEHDEAPGALAGRLSDDALPDPAVEQRIVRALQRSGVLRGGPARRPLLRSALLAAASFLVGLLIGRTLGPASFPGREAATATSEPPRAEVYYIVDM